MVRNGGIGFAAEGQLVPGSNAEAGALICAAKVSLDQDRIGVDGRRDAIPAEIRTGERRVIEFLLSCVVQAVIEAERE